MAQCTTLRQSPGQLPVASSQVSIGYREVGVGRWKLGVKLSSRCLTASALRSNVFGLARGRVRRSGAVSSTLMATQSKWQSLPTEQINLASLAVDKMPAREIVDLMVNEDRKVVAAVQKERDKIAHGIE